MLHALVDGLLAGYGIAIPVGAIAVLIVETGIRSGFRSAAAAGAGAATADLLYASTAVVGGAAVSTAITSVATPFKYASAAVLAAMAVAGLIRVGKTRRAEPGDGPVIDRSHLVRTYRTFLGMTLVNPLTVVYFTLFVIGSGMAAGLGVGPSIVFAAAAFAASLSWQTLLAGVGGLGHHTLSPRFRTWAGVAGNLVVLGLAVVVALR